ncbi:twin-arginine translocase subunit TatC [Mucisphaera calidilacus]|uniref:Sec-independent protein translocase protein TatC n=1 Tax=Mucisphaera calidilacus TaxID=2527982 RepID=A0A518BUV4_9BACT|nr:twin-arginine translocase subunit TatC [Mucisphaera calidilacus]QDU70762.1 Sec-independent protein translocase protein TatC [Mucisphaera calidilacus]
MPLDQPDEHQAFGEMSIGDHLEELRKRILYALIGTGVAAILTFAFGFQLIAWIARPLLQAQEALGYPPAVYAFDPTVGFTSVYLRVSLIAAAILASPWILYQLWRFIAVGLYAHEKRVVHILAPFSAVMTLLGVAFTYYILLPICLVFFIGWAGYYPEVEPGDRGLMLSLIYGRPAIETPVESEPDTSALQLPVLQNDPETLSEGMVWLDARLGALRAVIDGEVHTLMARQPRMLQPMPELGQFIGFAAFMGLGIVAAFQLPVIMLVVGWSGLIDPAWVRGFRRHALLAVLATSAILTPSDLLSMVVLALPLYTLFEFGLLLMAWVYRDPSFPEDA